MGVVWVIIANENPTNETTAGVSLGIIDKSNEACSYSEKEY